MPAPNYEIFALDMLRLRIGAFTKISLSSTITTRQPVRLISTFLVIRSTDRLFVVDTGFDPESGRRKGRDLLRSPAEALRRLGIDAETVEDVVLTHMHWDHAGGMRYFPRARFHLQDAEMAFCMGRCMCHGYMRRAFDLEHVVDAVRAVFADRMVFHNGEAELAPGSLCISLVAIRVASRRFRWRRGAAWSC